MDMDDAEERRVRRSLSLTRIASGLSKPLRRTQSLVRGGSKAAHGVNAKALGAKEGRRPVLGRLTENVESPNSKRRVSFEALPAPATPARAAADNGGNTPLLARTPYSPRGSMKLDGFPRGTRLLVWWNGHDTAFECTVKGARAVANEHDGQYTCLYRCAYEGGEVEHDLSSSRYEIVHRPETPSSPTTPAQATLDPSLKSSPWQSPVGYAARQSEDRRRAAALIEARRVAASLASTPSESEHSKGSRSDSESTSPASNPHQLPESDRTSRSSGACAITRYSNVPSPFHQPKIGSRYLDWDWDWSVAGAAPAEAEVLAEAEAEAREAAAADEKAAARASAALAASAEARQAVEASKAAAKAAAKARAEKEAEEAEAWAKAEAEAKAYAEATAEAEAKARAEAKAAEVRARMEADADAMAASEAEAEADALAASEAKRLGREWAKAEFEAKAERLQRSEQRKRDREARARRNAEQSLEDAMPWFGPADPAALAREIRLARRAGVDAVSLRKAERRLKRAEERVAADQARLVAEAETEKAREAARAEAKAKAEAEARARAAARVQSFRRGMRGRREAAAARERKEAAARAEAERVAAEMEKEERMQRAREERLRLDAEQALEDAMPWFWEAGAPADDNSTAVPRLAMPPPAPKCADYALRVLRARVCVCRRGGVGEGNHHRTSGGC